jgi:predicted RNA-binding Zn-ribbon protein involved in translation (DUF1610 family)
MTSNVPERAVKSQFCPDCGQKNSLREIFYGLPDGPPDPTVYRLGGCCISEDDPELNCVHCGWQGSAGEKGSRSDEENRTI